MNPLKERGIGTKTKAITTLFISSALLVGFMATMSMPQMIGSVYAQSEQGSENACKNLPGGELEKGECVAPATQVRTVTCEEVFGTTPTPVGESCTAVTTVPNPEARRAAEAECREAGGNPTFRPVTGGSGFTVTCEYPATITTTFTCPNDIVPTPGPNPQCITKPGNRS